MSREITDLVTLRRISARYRVHRYLAQ